jgi:hypothetical protein
VDGFFTPILDRIPLEGVRARLDRLIDDRWMEHDTRG